MDEEALAPGHPDLRIDARLYEQWGEALNTRENGQGKRHEVERILWSVRSFLSGRVFFERVLRDTRVPLPEGGTAIIGRGLRVSFSPDGCTAASAARADRTTDVRYGLWRWYATSHTQPVGRSPGHLELDEALSKRSIRIMVGALTAR